MGEQGYPRSLPGIGKRAALSFVFSVCLGCAANPPAEPQQTLLLVSLQDGSVIQQTVDLGADICFKTNGDSATTCLTRGEPIIDAEAGIIGYQMNSSQIDLVPR